MDKVLIFSADAFQKNLPSLCLSLLKGQRYPTYKKAYIGDMLTQGLAGGIDDSAKVAINAAKDLNQGIMDVMDGLADDMQSAVPSNFDLDADATVRSVAGGVSGANGGASYGALVSVGQMIVRSEDDIRRISQELYNLIQTGSRAQGRFSTA